MRTIMLIAAFFIHLDVWSIEENTEKTLTCDFREEGFIPSVFSFQDSYYLTYEIDIKSIHQNMIEIDSLSLINCDNKEVIKRYDKIDIPLVVYNQSNQPLKIRELNNDHSGLIYVWLVFEKNKKLPSFIRHSLSLGFKWSKPQVIEWEIKVPEHSCLCLKKPFMKSGVFLAANGPSADSSHRRAVVPLPYKKKYLPQRFAIDWIKVDGDGYAFHKSGHENEDWVGYGIEVVSSCEGLVFQIKNGIPDNKPGQRSLPINKDNALGNYVAVLAGINRIIVYAHLKPDSICVSHNQWVHAGELLGLLGNSGNSDAPHLHMHVTKGQDPLFSEGESYTFQQFELLGFNQSIYSALSGGSVFSPLTFTPQNSAKTNELMIENSIVRF